MKVTGAQLEEPPKCMKHAKRTVLSTDDVDGALNLRNVKPVYGFASGDPLRFKRAVYHNDLFYIDDREVDFKEARILLINESDKFTLSLF
nr:transcription initiation factor TFIID subunit 6-like [Lolium perenne]